MTERRRFRKWMTALRAAAPALSLVSYVFYAREARLDLSTAAMVLGALLLPYAAGPLVGLGGNRKRALTFEALHLGCGLLISLSFAVNITRALAGEAVESGWGISCSVLVLWAVQCVAAWLAAESSFPSSAPPEDERTPA